MKIKAALALLLLTCDLLFIFKIPIVSGEFELEELRLFSIKVYSNGSAICIFRRTFILATEDDVSVFEQYLSVFENTREGLLERFSNETRFMVNRASSITNRIMDARNFNVSAYMLQTITGFRGIVEYEFFWMGFASINDGEIHIGDVFEIGLVLLEKDELDIFYPKGYKIVEVNPDPDDIVENDRLLIWIGPKKFAVKTPAIKMVRETNSFFSNLQTYSLLIGLLVLGASILVVFYRFRISNKGKENFKHVPSATFEIESNVDKIVKILQESGGYSRQSILAEKLGLSKSKVSETLSDMERKGLIRRQKKGREKIVILLKKENGKET
jgi:DNA-binding transcriptional ArsR family regulator